MDEAVLQPIDSVVSPPGEHEAAGGVEMPAGDELVVVGLTEPSAQDLPPATLSLWEATPAQPEGEEAGLDSSSALAEATCSDTAPAGAPGEAWLEGWTSSASEAGPGEAPPAESAPPQEAVPGEPPTLTADQVRELIHTEVTRAQADMARLVQAELAREQQDRRRASLSSIQEVVDNIYDVKTESIRVELEALREQEQVTLKNVAMPLRERMEEVDFIRARIAKAEQEILEVESNATRRLDEAAHTLAELEGRAIVTELRQEVDRQKGIVDEVAARMGQLASEMEARVKQAAEAGLAAVKVKGGGLGLWPTVVALLVVAAVGVAGILLPRPSDAGPNTTFAVEMATMYQAAGEADDAIRVLDDAVKAGIRDASVLARVGQMYYSLKAYTKAANVMKQVVQARPTTQGYRLTLARSYAKSGKSPEAIGQYQELIRLNPNNVTYYLELGARYEATQKYDQALEQYQTVVKIAPDRWEGYYNQGQVYRLRLQQYDKAADQYLLALDKKPDHYLSLVYYGASLAGQGDNEGAIKRYKAAIEIAPESATAYYYLGEAYRMQKRYTEAVDVYQHAIELSPDFVLALVGLGNTYLEMGDCANATKRFSEVLLIQPANLDAQTSLAKCAGK